MTVVTTVDCGGIQRYVYRSRRLADVVAGSTIVDHVTSSAYFEANGADSIIYSGGGGGVCEFANIDAARRFATSYTTRVLHDAPGLSVYVGHGDSDDWHEAYRKAQLQLQIAKRSGSAPMIDPTESVIQVCAESGLAAGEMVRVPGTSDLQAVSPDVAARRRYERPDWSLRYLAEAPPGFGLPTQIEHLGMSAGEKSVVGVVHIDANGLGGQIRSALAGRSAPYEDLAEISSQIDASFNGAVTAIVSELTRCVRETEGDFWLDAGPNPIPLTAVDNVVMLPFRPVVAGGDDLTFLTDGRLAIDLAYKVLRHLELHGQVDLFPSDGIAAAAGVVIMPAGVSFVSGARRAEELCQEAKGSSQSAMVWELTTDPGVPAPKAETSRTPYTCDQFRDLDERILGPRVENAGAAAGLRGEWFRNRHSRVRGALRSAVQSTDEGALNRELERWRAWQELPADHRPDWIVERELLAHAIDLVDLHHTVTASHHSFGEEPRRDDH